MKRIRVLLFSKYAMVRSGMQRLFSSVQDIEVVAEVDNLRKAELALPKSKPDVILLETIEPPRSALAMVAEMIRISRKLPVVVVTVHDDGRVARAMLQAGVMGFVIKQSSDAELLLALRYAARRQKFLDPSLVDAVTLEVSNSSANDGRREGLSKREFEVLQGLVRGFTNPQIARDLDLSVKTIETYRSRIYQKLELHNRADLMRYAVSTGLISVNDPLAS
ncbi:MAG TPA: response regulator transcription factor [Terriglobales bacterium]|nr:response regulator transcription factor [Terriglobales bacterium]